MKPSSLHALVIDRHFGELTPEAAELLECFLWKQASEADPARVGEELADILYATLLLAHTLGIDMESALQDKLAKNAAKYPVDKARGSNRKYDEL